MHRRTILAIARKDALDILLNKATLIVLSIPILVSALFALVSGVVTSHAADLLVYNPSGSAIEQTFKNTFSQANLIHARSAQEVTAAFGADGAHTSSLYAAGLVVPAGYEQALRAGSQPQVTVYVNESLLSAQQGQLLLDTVILYGRRVVAKQGPANVVQVTINRPQPGQTLSKGVSAFYAVLALLASLVVGTTLMPNLLVEEKERKTLRMLLVSPASLADVIVGKMLVGMSYQLLMGLVVLGAQGALAGQVGLVLLFLLLGAAFSIMLGLLIGTIFRTMSAAGAFTGVVALIFILPGLLLGPLGQAFQSTTVANAMRVLPTYYLARGTLDAVQNQAMPGATLLNIGVMLGGTLALFLLALWILRRQASVLSTI